MGSQVAMAFRVDCDVPADIARAGEFAINPQVKPV